MEVIAADLALDLRPNVIQGGTGYAEGGGRVALAQPAGPTTRASVASQIDRFGAQGRTFGPRDLVIIQGGGNDFFAVGNSAPLDDAARALAGLVTRLEAAGAGTIVALNIQTITRFNSVFENALAAQGNNVLFYDVDALFNEIVASPGQFNITNITGTACGAVSSLVCLPQNYVTPNANRTFLLADPVHPAGITQQIQGEAITSLLYAPRQIGQLSFVAEGRLRAHRAAAGLRGIGGEEGAQLFGGAGVATFRVRGAAQHIGVRDEATVFNLGAAYRPSDNSALGVSFASSDGDGRFGEDRGGYDASAYSGTLFAAAREGGLRLAADATYGEIEFDDLTRRLTLGPALREHSGDTDGRFYGARAEASLSVAGEGAFVGPVVGVDYQNIRLSGYSEGTTLSTQATFGRQRLETLRGLLGFEVAAPNGGSLRARARLAGQYDVLADPRSITVTPTGAPVSFTSDALRGDRSFLSYEAAVDADVADGLTAAASVEGTALRDGMNNFAGTVGLRLSF